MLVIAKSVKGKEYMYDPRSAGKVSKRNAEVICKVCNDFKFLLNNENEAWHIHEVGEFDLAYDYAQFREFRIKNGVVKVVNK